MDTYTSKILHRLGIDLDYDNDEPSAAVVIWSALFVSPADRNLTPSLDYKLLLDGL